MKKIISPVFTQKTSKFPLGYWWLIEIYRLQMRQSSCFISEVCFKCHRALSTLFSHFYHLNSVQFSSVAQSCLTLCKPMNCSMPGLPVHRHLSEFTQTHVHRVCRPCKSFWHRTTMKHILSPYSHWRGTATLWGMSPLLAQGSGSTAPTIYRPPVPPEQALEEDTPSIQRDGTSINVWS